MGSHHNHELKISKFETPQALKTFSYVAILVAVITVGVGFFKNPERMWSAYLVSFFYFACLALGALFFLSFSNAAKAGWHSSIKRLVESFTSYLPYMVVTSIILILGFKHIYAWADPEQAHRMTGGKAIYLNPWFVTARVLIFGLGCLVFKKLIVGNSIKQDQNGDVSLTEKNIGNSIGFIAFFAIFFSCFTIDLLMSLLPSWYSTIFGIYAFAGMLQSTFALLAIVIVCFKDSKWIKGYVTVEHQHDVGKFLKGFTIFWAYIAFSQFMLIWYANIPEETEFYLMRSHSGWLGVSLSLLIFRFIVPFLSLLPRSAKRTDSNLVAVSILVLVMQYVDIYWLVYPNFNDGSPQFGFYEIALFAGFAGLFITAATRFLSANNIVAIKDPRMHESINHHVTY